MICLSVTLLLTYFQQSKYILENSPKNIGLPAACLVYTLSSYTAHYSYHCIEYILTFWFGFLIALGWLLSPLPSNLSNDQPCRRAEPSIFSSIFPFFPQRPFHFSSRSPLHDWSGGPSHSWGGHWGRNIRDLRGRVDEGSCPLGLPTMADRSRRPQNSGCWPRISATLTEVQAGRNSMYYMFSYFRIMYNFWNIEPRGLIFKKIA